MRKCKWAARTAERRFVSGPARTLVIVFSKRYRGPNGRVQLDRIEIPASQSGRYYREYPYFLWGTFLRLRESLAWPVEEARPSLEHLCRARRTVAFGDAGRLTPQWNRRVFEYFEQRLRGVNTDHPSLWRSGSGAWFLLIEPNSYPDVGELRACIGPELAVIGVPISVSPYCGGWSPAPGDLPESRSFLIARREDEPELLDVLRRLKQAAADAPAWNDVSGVRHG